MAWRTSGRRNFYYIIGASCGSAQRWRSSRRWLSRKRPAEPASSSSSTSTKRTSTLSLDGSAIVYVNSSVAALDALRGAPFDTASNAAIDRDAVRAWFTTPVTHVTRRPDAVSPQRPALRSRQAGCRRCAELVAGCAVGLVDLLVRQGWRSLRLSPGRGRASRQRGGDAGWTGDEIVAFRLHLPSNVVYTTPAPRITSAATSWCGSSPCAIASAASR